MNDPIDGAGLVPLPEARELSEDERRALAFALAAPDAPAALRLQATTVAVWGECDCGCASIGLGTKGPALPGADGVLVLEAIAKNVEGDPMEVNLHIVEGLLAELEMWCYLNGEIRTAPIDLSTLEYVQDG